jgi:hypothetical protein
MAFRYYKLVKVSETYFLRGHKTQPKEFLMKMTKRIILATGIILIDLFMFYLPLTALFLSYILIFNPPWFRDFLNNMKNSDESAPSL